MSRANVDHELRRRAEAREPNHVARAEVHLAQERDRRSAAPELVALGYGSGGRVEALCEEARQHRSRGDVVLEGECIRALDDLMGHYADGAFRGGAWLLGGKP